MAKNDAELTISNDGLELLAKKFKFMAFLDEARWGNEHANYMLPNFYDKELSGDKKLLTHFLGYITDRQTPYKIVFEKLDYIFSQMIDEYSQGKKVEELLDINTANSYFKKNNNNSYSFVSQKVDNDNSQYPKITESHKNKDGIITASSRFISTDYVAIRIALEILEERYHKSIVEFMKWAIIDDKSKILKTNAMERLLYALWVLGYSDIGSWKFYKDDNDKNKNIVIVDGKINDEIINIKQKKLLKLCILQNDQNWKDELPKFDSKRVTCFVRDLLKFKHFKVIFEKEIGNVEVLNKQIDKLELPGDVWNNNDKFRECLLKGVVDENNDLLKNKKSNIVVRMLFDKLKEKNIQDSCYPEQFDCTFSFVPRMCDSRSDIDNCNICPFKVNNITKAAPIDELFCLIDKEDDDYYPYKDDDEEFYDFVRVRNKYCPFLLYSCGYKAKCKDLKNCPNKVFAPINYSLKLELIGMLECYNTSRIMKYENHSEVIIHYCIFEHKDNANDQIEFWVMLHKNLKMDMGLCTYRKRRKLERDESDDDLIRDSKDYVYEYGNVPISRYLLKSNHEDDFHRITEALQFTEDVNCKDLYIHKLPDVKGEEQLKEEIMPIISETFSKLLEMCRELNMYT